MLDSISKRFKKLKDDPAFPTLDVTASTDAKPTTTTADTANSSPIPATKIPEKPTETTVPTITTETPPASDTTTPSFLASLFSTDDESKAVILRQEDESFFHALIDWDTFINTPDDAKLRPPLPPRPSAENSGTEESGKDNVKEDNPKDEKEKAKKRNRISAFFKRDKEKEKEKEKGKEKKEPEAALDAETQANELASILDTLNLSAKSNRTFSLSEESTNLVKQFAQILQDLINGVPTATTDLRNLLSDPDGTLSKTYTSLPRPLQKLIATLPSKLTEKFGPEMAAAAAKSQGIVLETEGKAAKVMAKEAVKKVVATVSLSEVVANPMVLVDMLKGILTVLKTRWPAVIGTNAVLSVALFLLMFVLWYCHKRGREVRLEKEAAETVVAGEGAKEGEDEVVLVKGMLMEEKSDIDMGRMLEEGAKEGTSLDFLDKKKDKEVVKSHKL